MAGKKYCPCILHILIRDGNFESRKFEEQKDIVIAGRPTPDMSKLRTFVLRQNQMDMAVQLNFDKIYYVKHDWLTGCDMASQLFCWPCVLFKSESQTRWSTTGWLDLIRLEPACTSHEKTPIHIKASIQLGELKQLIKARGYVEYNKVEGCYKELIHVNNESKEKVNKTNTFIENNKPQCSGSGFNLLAVDSSDEYSSECSSNLSNSILNTQNSRKRLSAGFKTINKLVNKLRKISDESEHENEFDVYCKCLAVQLKRMPLQQALLCQQRIQNAMTAERLDLHRLEEAQAQ